MNLCRLSIGSKGGAGSGWSLGEPKPTGGSLLGPFVYPSLLKLRDLETNVNVNQWAAPFLSTGHTKVSGELAPGSGFGTEEEVPPLLSPLFFLSLFSALSPVSPLSIFPVSIFLLPPSSISASFFDLSLSIFLLSFIPFLFLPSALFFLSLPPPLSLIPPHLSHLSFFCSLSTLSAPCVSDSPLSLPLPASPLSPHSPMINSDGTWNASNKDNGNGWILSPFAFFYTNDHH